MSKFPVWHVVISINGQTLNEMDITANNAESAERKAMRQFPTISSAGKVVYKATRKGF